jgi:hypothetical protein
VVNVATGFIDGFPVGGSLPGIVTGQICLEDYCVKNLLPEKSPYLTGKPPMKIIFHSTVDIADRA